MKRVFCDTNVFVYALDRKEPTKQGIADALVERVILDGTLVTSYQVIQEFLHLAITKFRKQMTSVEARKYAEAVLWPWCEVRPTPTLYATALSIHESAGWAFYDSLIVAAALEAECEILYSEDLQAGRVIRGLEILNPFA